jgi:hypothetical protein
MRLRTVEIVVRDPGTLVASRGSDLVRGVIGRGGSIISLGCECTEFFPGSFRSGLHEKNVKLI